MYVYNTFHTFLCTFCIGLNSTTLGAISKLMLTSDVTDDVIAVVRHVVDQLNNRLLSENDQSVEMPVNVKLWHTPGCHELLASLGMHNLVSNLVSQLIN